MGSNGVNAPGMSYLNYPQAIYYNGITYAAWQGGDNTFDPYIATYTHATKTWSAAVKIADSPLTNDSHGSPALCIDSDGVIHAFYGSHDSAQKHAKSDNPEDISAWTVQADAVIAGATYPQPIADGNNIWLFYRQGDSSLGKWSYKKSEDKGATWGAEIRIIDFYTVAGYSVYAGIVEHDTVNGRFHIGWCYRHGVLDRRNIYHAYLNTSDSKMYSMDGTDLGTTITKAEGDASCIVSNSGTYTLQSPALHLDSNGYPYLLWPQDSATGFNTRFTRWTGSAWATIDNITQPDNWSVSDFILYSSTRIEAYLTVANNSEATGGDIERWDWNGSTWTKRLTIMYASFNNRPLLGPLIPFNFDEDCKLFFSQFVDDMVTADLKTYHYTDAFLLITTDDDFEYGENRNDPKSSNGGNYEVETTLDNPGITNNQIESGSGKGDDYNYTKNDADTQKWTPEHRLGSGVTMNINDTTLNKLYLNKTGAVLTEGGVKSGFKLPGDFDIYIDVDLTYSAVGTVWFGLYIAEELIGDIDFNNLIRITRNHTNAAGHYISSIDRAGGAWGAETTQATADKSLSLRITRVGNVFRTYYDLTKGSETWVELASGYTHAWGDIFIYMGVGVSSSALAMTAEVEKYKLTSGALASGGYRTSYEWTSYLNVKPAEKILSTITIDHSNLSGDHTITPKILDADDNILYTGSAIITGASTTLTTSDFGTINEDYKIRLDGVGDGDDTSVVTEIAGTFETIERIIDSVTNPGKVNSVANANISKINGVS